MRVVLAMLLTIVLGASTLPARAADGTDDGATPTAVSKAPAVAEKSKKVVEPEKSASESEVMDLRNLVEEQKEELKAQQLRIEALEEKLGAKPSEPEAAPAALSSAIAPVGPISSTIASPVNPAATPPQNANEEASPLQFRIGSAYITPIGFVDFTGVYRSHNQGTGIGTNFAGIQYGDTFNTNLSELRESMQNSRFGFRVDALVKGAHVIGYMESDFLGNNPGNVAVSSNSNTVRSRLYWVDVQKGKWEVLGGQTWSLITPGRTGISPLPADVFFTQDIDVNYQAGLVWGRIPELRFVVHPTDKAAFAFALDSPEQYIGGSSGGPTITFPTALTGLSGTQLNNGNTTLTTPNPIPDFIAKFALDPTSRFHFEIAGLVREFKVWNSLPVPGGTTFSKVGAGGSVNLSYEVFKGFRLLTNNFWADGGGRYIFGQVPDLIVRADDTLSPIKAASTVSGFEFNHRSTLLYAYYGRIYAYRNLALDANGLTPIGYGVPTSSSQNRSVEEETLGFNQTLWRSPAYGALNFMGQYSHVLRDPWATLTPPNAHVDMVFLNLRYTLPGAAPTLGSNAR